MRKIILIAVLLVLVIAINCVASGVYYLPDVNSEMSSYSYWADETDVYMSLEEIQRINKKIISANGTNTLSRLCNTSSVQE